MSWADYLEAHLFTCSIKALTGLDCPGCGIQRAAIALLRGDLWGSFCYNASLIPFLITLIFTLVHLAVGFKHGARAIVWLFSFTVAVMIGQFLVKLISNH